MDKTEARTPRTAPTLGRLHLPQGHGEEVPEQFISPVNRMHIHAAPICSLLSDVKGSQTIWGDYRRVPWRPARTRTAMAGR